MSQKRLKRSTQASQREHLTQQTLEETFAEVTDPVEAANNIVRYIIIRAGEIKHFTKSEFVSKCIGKPGGKFEEIMNIVRKTLRTVYGYNIILCDKLKTKHYIVTSVLPAIKDPSENIEVKVPEDINKVLLLLVLSHIFMANGEVSDVSLFSFLKHINIDVDLRHPLFGDAKEYINKVLVEQEYLVVKIDDLSRKHTFKWGARAETEISKMAILKFVCKMFKDRQPSSWVNQYKIASEQPFENYQEGGMDTVEPEM
ncbi:non-structural maintenance of chromosomes element 3 homolog [Anthonomus grandis grandis]|uniref:non-structural maintenance of chromosomes element 3 homolog n=1 Tax=Anthonomus grandis grandis TaxID=2921223 RepID=UPI002165E076|nr:non-structural maintenance of chromosomes element 3 homolog [Anthonomus grandis grandis]XP_050300215.1 non-structural maintenance of chromosomes element 3 homolog [Anthonomus grandis grandis]